MERNHLAGEPNNLGRVFHLTDPSSLPAERVFWLEAERESRSASSCRGAGGGDIAVSISGGASETHEIWDGNTYDSNTRHALRGRGLRRSRVDASLGARDR